MNGLESTARIIPAMQVRVDEGRLRVIPTGLPPVKPREAAAALLTASNPLDVPGSWSVEAIRVSPDVWLLRYGRRDCGLDAESVHVHEVDCCDEVIVYLPSIRCCFVLRKDKTVTDDEIHDEMGRRDWRLASTIGAWYRWLMTEVA